MSVNSKMSAIADEIRTLSGTSGVMGLDAMATNIGDANTEVSTQADLIAQIASALEGKTAGGGSGASVETCTVNVKVVVDNSGYTYLGMVCTTVSADELVPSCRRDEGDLTGNTYTFNNVLCGSLFSVADLDGRLSVDSTENCELWNTVYSTAYVEVSKDAGSICTIQIAMY